MIEIPIWNFLAKYDPWTRARAFVRHVMGDLQFVVAWQRRAAFDHERAVAALETGNIPVCLYYLRLARLDASIARNAYRQLP